MRRNQSNPERLDKVAVEVFQPQTSTSERPLAPVPTTISGMEFAPSFATLSDTPPWNDFEGVLNGVKLATGMGWTAGVSVVMWLTSKTLTVAFMPAPFRR